MTLDELNELGREASNLQISARIMRDAELSLANLRRNNKSFKDVYTNLVNNEYRYSHGRRSLGTFIEVVDEHLPELLRVAELRLQAQARTAKQREKLLLDQIDGFLNGSDSGASDG